MKWLIYRNDYLTVYNNMEQKSMWCVNIYANPEKKVFFTDLDIYYLLKKQKILRLFALFLFLQRFMENLCTTHPTVVAFIVRNIISLNEIFSIFPLAEVIRPVVYLNMSLNIKDSVLYDRNFILCFNSFDTVYVSRSIKLYLCLGDS